MRQISLLVVCAASSSFADCTKDTDCKGNRICESGVCVEGSQQDAPVVEVPPPPLAPPPRPNNGVHLADLTAELRAQREELEGAGIVAPIIKLAGSTAAFVGGFLFLAIFAPQETSVDTHANDILFGSIFTGVGCGLAVWGGIQLGLRLYARSVLPERIAKTEAEIARLSQ